MDDQDLVGLFVALGQFERKGLPLLMQALATAGMERVKLIVVGGEADLLARYREQAEKLGIGDRVRFVGMQSDVRPFLWSSDVFVFPSLYETFLWLLMKPPQLDCRLSFPALRCRRSPGGRRQRVPD